MLDFRPTYEELFYKMPASLVDDLVLVKHTENLYVKYEREKSE